MMALYAVSKRVSSLMPVMRASLRLRAAAASNRCVSRALAICARNCPVLTRLSKLTFAPDYPKLGGLPNFGDKAVLCAPLALELGEIHHRRIYFSTKLILRRRECAYRVGEGQLADDHDVNVTP